MTEGRFVSTCTLGPLISGEIAAVDSLQGTGLIKYRGACQINGIIRPTRGAVVTMSYTIDGVTQTIPKKMRVLSSFANPLTKVTSVELGCLLSYKEGTQEPERVDTELANKDFSGVGGGGSPWDRYPALATAYSSSWGASSGGGVPADYWDSDYKRVGASISAKWAMAYCLAKLEITSAAIPLTNTFRMQAFDFSAGWVQVISDLLYSEGYVGELDFDEILQIRSLADDVGTGPVLYEADILSAGPINTGEIPPNTLKVEYPVWRFYSTPDPTQQPSVINGGATEDNPDWAGGTNYTTSGSDEDSDRYQPPLPPPKPPTDDDRTRDPDDIPGWEVSETEGPETFYPIKYKTKAGKEKTEVYSHWPATITKTQFGFVNGQRVPTFRRELRTSIIAAEAADYVAAKLREGEAGRATEIIEYDTVTEFEYYPNGERKSETKRSFVPKIAIAGTASLDFSWPQGVLEVSGEPMEHERVKVEYYPAGNGEAQVTTRWISWLKTQSGQQASAAANKQIKNLSQAYDYAHRIVNSGLYLLGQETEIARRSQSDKPKAIEKQSEEPLYLELGASSFTAGWSGPTDYANTRWSATSFDERARPSDGDSSQRTETIEVEWEPEEGYNLSSATVTMPYNADDEITSLGGLGGWEVKKSDAQEKATRFGRIQLRLTYGYRNGMEIQINPTKMQSYTFAPFYLSIEGLVAQYRTNNLSWVLSQGEVVASCNAIYWGVVGTT